MTDRRYRESRFGGAVASGGSFVDGFIARERQKNSALRAATTGNQPDQPNAGFAGPTVQQTAAEDRRIRGQVFEDYGASDAGESLAGTRDWRRDARQLNDGSFL